MNPKRIFFIVILGLVIVNLVLYFTTSLKIDVTISILVLAATAWAIAAQSFATEEMAKNQIRPSVDVSMIFNKEKLGTFFQFLNITKVPALVWITLDIKDKNGKRIEIKDEYLTGKKRIDIDVKSWITAPGFLKELTDRNELLEADLKVEVAPMFNKKERHLFQEKFYRFDPNAKEWLRTPFWLIAESIDPSFLVARKNIENEDKI